MRYCLPGILVKGCQHNSSGLIPKATAWEQGKQDPKALTAPALRSGRPYHIAGLRELGNNV